MEYGKPFLLNIFTFNDLRGYLVENPIQTLIIRRHIVFLVWLIKRAGAVCAPANQEGHEQSSELMEAPSNWVQLT